MFSIDILFCSHIICLQGYRSMLAKSLIADQSWPYDVEVSYHWLGLFWFGFETQLQISKYYIKWSIFVWLCLYFLLKTADDWNYILNKKCNSSSEINSIFFQIEGLNFTPVQFNFHFGQKDKFKAKAIIVWYSLRLLLQKSYIYNLSTFCHCLLMV